jgi:predicted ATP-grasp superfamily ATP-dependent carboligase
LRIFVCEYVTGGGLTGQPLPPELAREGDMMLAALLKDLFAIAGIEIVTTRDARLPEISLPVEVLTIQDATDPWSVWSKVIHSAEAVWPIAPETGGILARISDLVVGAGKQLLGSDPAAVRLTSSKLATARHLAKFGIPTPPTVLLDDRKSLGDASAWVIKPDDGAGAENTWAFETAGDLNRWIAENPTAGMVLQPWVDSGPPMSLSLLCRGGAAWLLTVNVQRISFEGNQFHYRGGIVGAVDRRRARFEPIAAAVAAAIPGLWGYVGMDFVDAEPGPVVLDINPRLTTSYAVLAAAIGLNPAALVLDLLKQGIPDIQRPLGVRAQVVDVEHSDG